jgi:hypothetical protein
VACGVGQELYVFGGVRSRDSDNPESSTMTTCKSEFFHDEMKRSIIGLTLIKYILVFIHALARTVIDWVYPCYLKTKRPYIYCVCRLSTSFNLLFFCPTTLCPDGYTWMTRISVFRPVPPLCMELSPLESAFMWWET